MLCVTVPHGEQVASAVGVRSASSAQPAVEAETLQLAHHRTRLATTASALCRLGVFVVHDTEFDAPSALRVALADVIRSVLREAAPPLGCVASRACALPYPC